MVLELVQPALHKVRPRNGIFELDVMACMAYLDIPRVLPVGSWLTILRRRAYRTRPHLPSRVAPWRSTDELLPRLTQLPSRLLEVDKVAVRERRK